MYTLKLRQEDVTGGWGKLHNEELHNLYVLPKFGRIMKCVRHATRKREAINSLTILDRTLQGELHLRGYRCRWEDNIKMDFTEIRYDGVGCSKVIQIGSNAGLSLTLYSVFFRSYKSRQFIDQLKTYQLFKEDLQHGVAHTDESACLVIILINVALKI
jgi:hypothetical protein